MFYFILLVFLVPLVVGRKVDESGRWMDRMRGMNKIEDNDKEDMDGK